MIIIWERLWVLRHKSTSYQILLFLCQTLLAVLHVFKGLVIFLQSKRIFVTYAWSCSLYEKGTYLAWELSIENSVDCLLFMFSSVFTYLMSSFFSLLITLSLYTIVDANVFVLVHHKDWLTYSDGTDRLGVFLLYFSISGDLTEMDSFSPWIPDWGSQNVAFLDFFLSINPCIFWWFSLIGKFWQLLSQFPQTFLWI